VEERSKAGASRRRVLALAGSPPVALMRSGRVATVTTVTAF
jgi:hypothetical protein